MTPIVQFEAVSRAFGSLLAVDQVTLDVRPGEVLALLGENGAGKSTLMKALCGVHPPTDGQILIDGKPSEVRGPSDAARCGVGMVFQNFSLLPALSVLDNLLLAWPKTPFWIGRKGDAVRRTTQTLQKIAPAIKPAARVADLSVAEQQLVELAKVLNLDARVVVLDEPTAVLTPSEAKSLYGFIRGLAQDGIAVVLITHKMDDVEACADRIAVMRRGKLVDVFAKGALGPDEIVQRMMGATIAAAAAPPTPPTRRRERLHLRDVNAASPGMALRAVSLTVATGEIVGVAGVAGNGQTLLSEVIAGVHPLTDGDVVLDGASICRHPDDAPPGTPLGYIPEQPRQAGVIESLSVGLNLSLRHFGSRREAQPDAAQLLDRFDVRPRDLTKMAGTLSGGNLQKLVLARELGSQRDAVLACYPTMGLDLVATANVYEELFAQARGGAAVLWISEDLDDLLAHAHRIAVLREGRLVAVLENDGTLSREQIGALMTGRHQEVAA